MPPAMSGQEHHVHAIDLSADQHVRRSAIGRVDVMFLHILKCGHLIEPAAPQNADFRLNHVRLHCK